MLLVSEHHLLVENLEPRLLQRWEAAKTTLCWEHASEAGQQLELFAFLLQCTRCRPCEMLHETTYRDANRDIQLGLLWCLCWVLHIWQWSQCRNANAYVHCMLTFLTGPNPSYLAHDGTYAFVCLGLRHAAFVFLLLFDLAQCWTLQSTQTRLNVNMVSDVITAAHDQVQ